MLSRLKSKYQKVFDGIGVYFSPDTVVPPSFKKRWINLAKIDCDRSDLEVKKMIAFLRGPTEFYEVRQVTLGGVVQKGLFADRAIPKGTVIGHYAGELVPLKEVDSESDYIFDVPKGFVRSEWVIDAQNVGNEMRFINHAPGKQANLTPIAHCYYGKLRIFFFANREIAQGEQFFFDYGKQYWEASCSTQ